MAQIIIFRVTSLLDSLEVIMGQAVELEAEDSEHIQTIVMLLSKSNCGRPPLPKGRGIRDPLRSRCNKEGYIMPTICGKCDHYQEDTDYPPHFCG
ncbi:MAG: hypothetical protein PHW20_07375 [Clostridia bacterium]|nr:hypothetical protein [Clostridia bacterium]